MFNSKPVIFKDESKESKIISWYYTTELPVVSHIRDSISHVAWVIRRIIRSYDYLKLGFKTYDFDAGYVHEMALFQLKRIDKVLKNGHLVQEPIVLKTLGRCIKYMEAYTKDDNRHFGDLSELKWGRSKMSFKKVIGTDDKPEGLYFSMVITYPKATNEEEQKHAAKEWHAAYEIDDRRRDKKLQLAYKILMKYHNYWWD